MKRLTIVLVAVMGIVTGILLSASWDLTEKSDATTQVQAVVDPGDLEFLQRTNRAFTAIAKRRLLIRSPGRTHYFLRIAG